MGALGGAAFCFSILNDQRDVLVLDGGLLRLRVVCTPSNATIALSLQYRDIQDQPGMTKVQQQRGARLPGWRSKVVGGG